MKYVVVVIETDALFDGSGRFRTFGTYDTLNDAMKARDRKFNEAQSNIGSHQRFAHRAPRAYVTELEEERR